MYRSSVAVCTLWEGDYHKGLGVLVNSLVSAGFQGTVWAGYRGALPSWASASVADGEWYRLSVSEVVSVVFVLVQTSSHFSQYKPDFCLYVLKQAAPEASAVYYFDPDVIILAPWKFFEHWVQTGIAVCEDSHYPLNANHPIVSGWRRYAEAQGFSLVRPITSYLNSGVAGISRQASSFLYLWARLLSGVQRDYHLAGQAHHGTRADLFHNVDQDVLNIALAVSDELVSQVGVDGMAFAQGEWLTLHATGRKPWRRRILRDLIIEGIGPDRALRRYWEFAGGPIRVESAGKMKRSRFLISTAALLSRFYGKN